MSGDHFEVIFAQLLADKFDCPIKISPKQSLEKRQKKALRSFLRLKPQPDRIAFIQSPFFHWR